MRASAAVLLALIATLLLLAATAPTFDFDEALYRRVAEEMKGSHEYFVATWDGRPFFEKPPTYIWSIVLASTIVDGPGAHVSVFASRLPSLMCSLLTMLLLAWFWRRNAPQYARSFGVSIDDGNRWLLSPLLPLLAYGAGLFPIGGASGVVLDPMLTFCLMAPLLSITCAFMRCNSPDLRFTRAEIVVSALGMAAATSVKGLIGFVLPAFALGLHALVARSTKRWSRASCGQVAAMFAGAIGAASLFFLFIYQFTGPQFLYEFFIRQHLVRATKPLQGHGGSLLFHVAVVLLLGGPLVAFVLRALTRRHGLAFARWGFPLTWTVAVIAFYTAVATKLPNYTWPVWPALVIALCVLIVRGYASVDGVKPKVRAALIGTALLPLIPIALLLIALGAGLDAWVPAPAAARAAAIMSAVEPLPVAVRIGLLVAGLTLAMQILDVRRFGRQFDMRSGQLWRPVASAAILNCVALSILGLVVLPSADRLLRGPLVRLSRDASLEHVDGGDFVTVGLFSPTISSNYDAGRVRQVGRFMRSDSSRPGQHLLVVPAWQLGACRQPGFVVIRHDEFLTLCEKGRAHR